MRPTVVLHDAVGLCCDGLHDQHGDCAEIRVRLLLDLLGLLLDLLGLLLDVVLGLLDLLGILHVLRLLGVIFIAIALRAREAMIFLFAGETSILFIAQ
jgi:hypothetical protein